MQRASQKKDDDTEVRKDLNRQQWEELEEEYARLVCNFALYDFLHITSSCANNQSLSQQFIRRALEERLVVAREVCYQVVEVYRNV